MTSSPSSDDRPEVIPATGDLRNLWPIAVGRNKRRDFRGATVGVLLALHYYSDWVSGENARPGTELLSKLVGVSEKTARTALIRGQEAGYVELARRGGGRGGKGNASVYRLTLPVVEAAELRAAVTSGKVAASPEVAPTGQSQRDASDSPEPMPSGHSPTSPEGIGSGHSANSDNQRTISPEDMTSGESERDSGMTGSFREMTGSHDFQLPTNHTFQEKEGGLRKVTNSLAEPIDSPTPSKSISVQEPSSAANAAPTRDGEPSRFCDRHPNDTTEFCWRCGKARERHKEWKAKEKQAEEDRRTQEALERMEAREAARSACTVCEGKSEAEKDRCFHEPDSVEAWQRNRFQLNAVRSEIQRKQEQQAPAEGGSAMPTRTTKSGRRPAVPRFRSGNDSERAAAREELRRHPPVPVPTGLTPEDGTEAVRPQNAITAA